MPKYQVELRCTVWLTVDVEADSEDQAADQAMEKGHLQQFAGNGQMYGKLIGTSDPSVTIINHDDLEVTEVDKM